MMGSQDSFHIHALFFSSLDHLRCSSKTTKKKGIDFFHLHVVNVNEG